MSGTTKITVMGGLATILASLALLPAYEEPGWFWPAILVVAFLSGIGLGLRHLGTPRLLIPLAQLAALNWAFILVFAREDLRLGLLPTGASMEAFGERLNDGLLIVTRYAAPVPGDPDLAMVTALGIGLIAVAVDALAATFRLVPWAGLPLLLLYSIPATTVTGGLSALSFIPPAIGYTLLLTSEGRQRLSHWGRVIGFADNAIGPQEAISTSLLGQTGRRVGIAVIGLAVIVPALIPALPEGAFGSGGGPGDGGSGGSTIRVNNPIVDLKRDLRLPDDVEVIRYETDAEPGELEYIRMVVLDTFDGRQWAPSQRQIRELNGPGDTAILPDPPGLSSTVDSTKVRSRFELLETLQPKWLPVNYPPVSLTGDADWGYDPDTLDIVNRSGGTFSEVTYQLTSLRVHHAPEDLAVAGPVPDKIEERYVKLPGSVPESLYERARRVVGDADNAYDQATALQSWFRSEFIYDLSVRTGHGGSALMDFLADRRGYCEQFAATMAIMARTLGIPARVAVGYMPGQNVEGDTYVVSAHDAHAWPELYFAGHGWVRFEPTPSIQTGTAPDWTVPDTGGVAPLNPRSSVNPQDNPQNRPDLDRRTSQAIPPNDPNRTLDGLGGTEPSISPLPFLLGGLALLVLLTPAAARLLIRRRRLAPTNINGGVEQGWQELAATVRDLGLKWDESATPRVTAERFEPKLGSSSAEAMHRLALAVEELRYAPKLPNTPGLNQDVLDVCETLRRRAGRAQRVFAWLLPRSLWGPMGIALRPVTWLLDGVDTLVPRLARRLRRTRTRTRTRVAPSHRA